MPDRLRCAIGPIHDINMSTEANRVGHFRTLKFPGEARREPLLRQLNLPPIAQLLAEDSVVVANAVAIRRDLQRRHALHEAGGESAEAAIAESGIGLEGAQLVEINAELTERDTRGLGESEVAKRIHQLPSNEELEREVVDALRAVRVGTSRRLHPVTRHVVTGRECGGDVPVAFPSVRGILADGIQEFADDAGAEVCDGVGTREASGVDGGIGRGDGAQGHDDMRGKRRRAGPL